MEMQQNQPEEQDDFLNDYPQINQPTLTNWMAHQKKVVVRTQLFNIAINN